MLKETRKHTGMFTSQLLLLGLQAKIGVGLAIGTLPNTEGLSRAMPDNAPVMNLNSLSIHPFNATLGDPPDPLDVPWARNCYLTTFDSYSEPSLPYNSIRAFIDLAISSLHELKQANDATPNDPIPGGMFQYQAEVFSPLMIRFHLALDPPSAPALTYYETGGVIASLVPYMRKWRSSAPASAALELWKREGAVSERKASGYIAGVPKATHQW